MCNTKSICTYRIPEDCVDGVLAAFAACVAPVRRPWPPPGCTQARLQRGPGSSEMVALMASRPARVLRLARPARLHYAISRQNILDSWPHLCLLTCEREVAHWSHWTPPSPPRARRSNSHSLQPANITPVSVHSTAMRWACKLGSLLPSVWHPCIACIIACPRQTSKWARASLSRVHAPALSRLAGGGHGRRWSFAATTCQWQQQ